LLPLSKLNLGPLAFPSLHGHKYFLTLIDDFTRHTWIFLVKLKSKARTLMHNFVTFIKSQFGITIKCIRSDNVTEFNDPILFSTHGIVHQTSCIETPQQKSIAERKHHHILNVTSSLLFQANLPKDFWFYVVAHVVYIINRLPNPTLHKKSPFETLWHKPATLLNLKVFGSLCFASTRTTSNQTWPTGSQVHIPWL